VVRGLPGRFARAGADWAAALGLVAAAGSPIDSIHRGSLMIARGGSCRSASAAEAGAAIATVAANNSDRETERGRHRSVATKKPSLESNNLGPKAGGR